MRSIRGTRRFLPSLALSAISCLTLAQAPKSPVQPLTELPYSPSLNLSSLDRTVDPCVDFYRYSCGGWLKSNPIPEDQSGWTVYGKMSSENRQFLWGILEDLAKSKERSPGQQKIGDYFAACMDEAAIDKRGLSPLSPELARIEAFETRAGLIDEIMKLHKGGMGSFFFEAGPGPDPADSNAMIAQVRSGGLGLPDRDYYTKDDSKSVETRNRYLDYTASLFSLMGETHSQAIQDAAAVLRIETALARASLTRVQLRDPYNSYHKMPLAQLIHLAPRIPWSRYFTLQGAANPGAINVTEPEFLKAVAALLETEPLPGLKAYIRFHMLDASAPYLSGRFEQASFEFHTAYMRGAKTLQPRWKRCTGQVDDFLGEALGQEFVRRAFSSDTRQRTAVMVEQVEAAMQDEIERLDWMSEPTKQEALRKLHAIHNKIGYPDRWRDYSALTIDPHDYFGNVSRAISFESQRGWAKVGKPVDRDEWNTTPPTVNAFYNDEMNDITLPAGILLPPLFDPRMDDAPNYGNEGANIGHELTHAFDDEGRLYDAKGDLKDWWTKEDAQKFEERMSCVRDQYAKFIVVDDIHINSKLTSGEDLADIGGTLLAYIAWKKATASQTLRSIDGFTPDQRFFVGMAQWVCHNARPESLRLNAITDGHSPAFARINGVVSNMPQFAEAFGCKKGQPMVNNPVCKVW